MVLLVAVALAEPVVATGFDVPGVLPAGWSTQVGATTGSGDKEPSIGIVPEGRDGSQALRFVGRGDVERWPVVLSRAEPAALGDRFLVEGWVRTEGLRREGGQFDNRYLGMVFEDAKGEIVEVGGKPVQAVQAAPDQDWTRLSICAAVPDGAVSGRVVLFVSMTGTAWVDDVSAERIPAPEWAVTETTRHRFHTLPGGPMTEAQRKRNGAILAELEGRLGLRASEPIDYFRYPDRATKTCLTGNAGNAHVSDEHTLHSLWPIDSHETVHLIARQNGRCDSPFLVEGLAVAMSGQWMGEGLDVWVRRFREDGRLPPLSRLLTSFREVDDSLTYPVAGSFVAFLLRREDMSTFLTVYYGEGSVHDRLREAYGTDLETLEREWLAGIGG